MAVVDVRNIRVIEGNSGSSRAEFTLFLDAPATAPVEVAYFVQGVTATEGQRDIFDTSGTARSAAGQSSITISNLVIQFWAIPVSRATRPLI